MFRALSHRDFRLLWIGSFVANLGFWMQQVALGWLIYDLTKSASKLGQVSFASAAPTLVLGLLGGAIADRAERKRILWGCALIFAAGAVTLASLTAYGTIQVWMVILVSLTTGSANAIYSPTFQSLIPTLVEAESLRNALSLNSLSFNGARIIGPAIAGWIVAHLGSTWCFALTACGYLGMVACAARMQVPRRPSVSGAPLAHALVEGLRYAARHRQIRALLFLCGATSLFGFAFIILLPALARAVLHLEVQGFGSLYSALGSGAVGASLIIASSGEPKRKGPVSCGATLLFGLLVIGLSQARSLYLAQALLAAIGACMIVGIASLNTLLQLNTSEAMRGRIMSMMTICLFGFPTLGSIGLGAVADWTGIPDALALGGACVALSAAGTFIFTPELRRS